MIKFVFTVEIFEGEEIDAREVRRALHKALADELDEIEVDANVVSRVEDTP